MTLTGKSCGLEERAPMCGVPFHAVDGYLNKLVSKGYKVAICEQVEDPKLAKGLVKRAVTRVVTPGTNLDTKALDESRNNYLMCVVYTTNAYGVSYVDVTTGDYYLAEFESENQLLDEIGKVVPSEIICNDPFLVSGIDFADLQARLGMVVSAIDAWYFDEDKCYDTLKHHFKVGSLNGLGLDGYSMRYIAAEQHSNISKNDIKKFRWIILPRSHHMSQIVICFWIVQPEETWNYVKPCVKKQKEDHFSGCLIRQKQLWEQECYAMRLNSHFLAKKRSIKDWIRSKH